MRPGNDGDISKLVEVFALSRRSRWKEDDNTYEDSTVQLVHEPFRIAGTGCLKGCQYTVDIREFFCSQVYDFTIFHNSAFCRCTWDGDEDWVPFSLRKLADPIDGELGGCDAFLISNLLHSLDKLQVVVEVLRAHTDWVSPGHKRFLRKIEIFFHRVGSTHFWTEPWKHKACVTLGDVFDALPLAREKSSTNGRVGDDGDVVLGTRLGDALGQDMV